MTSALDAHCAFVYPGMSRLSPLLHFILSLYLNLEHSWKKSTPNLEYE